MRILANVGELWRTHNAMFTTTSLIFTRVPAKVSHVHQSSGAGAFCMSVALSMCAKWPKTTFHQSGESNRPLTPILLKSIAIHLPFLLRYFCKSMALPFFWQKVVNTPICITIRLPFVSRYFCRSFRVRGRWDTSKSRVAPHHPKSGPIHISPADWFIAPFHLVWICLFSLTVAIVL